MKHFESLLAACPSARCLSGDEARRLLDAWASSFGVDTSQVWWWTTDFERAERSRYESSTWAESLTSALAGFGGRLVYLVLTDDEPSPWDVYVLPRDGVVAALGELPLLEFFVVSEDHGSLLFDTHHDEHVLVRRRGEGEGLSPR